MDRQLLRERWEQAVAEDGIDRDVTSLVAVAAGATGRARLLAREAGVFAGEVVFDLLKEAYAPDLVLQAQVEDGQRFQAESQIAELTGGLRLLLGIERTLLNFLQRLCGVATLARRYVDAVEGTGASIYDTRKTIPGWRQLDKYAVRCGGGRNHRLGLHDAVLVKDNHLAGLDAERLAATAVRMVEAATALSPPPRFIEFEVDSLEQFDVLLQIREIDVILLDNFTPAQMREAVSRRDVAGLGGRLELEASGGVSLEEVRAVAQTGVERISVGAITHSAPALDISLEIEPGA
jgi:nicotinate-nucleotide pyrophosphorylase (carboxylating)